MIPVATAAQTRAMDSAVINDIGISCSTLMELAGKGLAEALHERFPCGVIAVFSGPGNNGGDGYVAARWLSLWGRTVRIWGAHPKSEEAAVNRSLCERMGIDFMSPKDAATGATIAVDALLGTGSRRAPSGEIAQALEAMSAVPTVVAVDIPTGIDTDTGQNMGGALESKLTVTLGRWKPGLLASPGCDLAGEICCVDLGLDLSMLADNKLAQPFAKLLQRADIDNWRPQLGQGDAKWDRGHVAIVAGGGAATLAAHGAFRGGAGLVTLLAPKPTWDTFHGLWPEVILAEPGTLNPSRHDTVVIGPGLGVEHGQTVLEIWQQYPGSVVADADALTILASHTHTTPTDRPRVITPHSAEASRLLRCTRAEVEADRFSAVEQLSKSYTAVLKGPHTLIADSSIWVNRRGSARLATAGSGDVLAGMIGGLLASGVQPDRAAAIAAWDHAEAGETMPPGGTASDLVDALAQGKSG